MVPRSHRGRRSPRLPLIEGRTTARKIGAQGREGWIVLYKLTARDVRPRRRHGRSRHRRRANERKARERTVSRCPRHGGAPRSHFPRKRKARDSRGGLQSDFKDVSVGADAALGSVDMLGILEIDARPARRLWLRKCLAKPSVLQTTIATSNLVPVSPADRYLSRRLHIALAIMFTDLELRAPFFDAALQAIDRDATNVAQLASLAKRRSRCRPSCLKRDGTDAWRHRHEPECGRCRSLPEARPAPRKRPSAARPITAKSTAPAMRQ